jgi:hypothetical protein
VFDISPLKEVPYLILKDCTGISDFSCLGSHQKRLDVSGIEHIKDSDLIFFKNIPILILSFCPKITNLKMLTGVIRLKAIFCMGLENIEINDESVEDGKDEGKGLSPSIERRKKITVDLAYCKNLRSVTVNCSFMVCHSME